jgi:enoyl-CoA hydratase/carnithine racemase
MGTVQGIAATPTSALDRAVEIANQVAACGPLGIKTTLASAHLAVDPSEADALSRLDAQYGALTTRRIFRKGGRQKPKLASSLSRQVLPFLREG